MTLEDTRDTQGYFGTLQDILGHFGTFLKHFWDIWGHFSTLWDILKQLGTIKYSKGQKRDTQGRLWRYLKTFG